MGTQIDIVREKDLPEEWKKLIRTPLQLKGLSPEARHRVRMAVMEKASQIAGANYLDFAARQGHINVAV